MHHSRYAFIVLVILSANSLAQVQSKATVSDEDKRQERLSSSLEEIAMCHHAIKTVYHEAVEVDQNPYHRYVLGVVLPGGHNRFPWPDRCKTVALQWIVPYAQLSDKDKVALDRSTSADIGMTISDMAKDVEFMTVVSDKILLEGNKAGFLENEDKHIPRQ